CETASDFARSIRAKVSASGVGLAEKDKDLTPASGRILMRETSVDSQRLLGKAMPGFDACHR
ncbi:hypothetical protein, partial [Bacillus pseudomycoides]|uniref:hypothetical protein n=1 Tax=Bacillus pseudomycoides TaxID=64104 RepID=UPI00195510E9